MRLLLSLLASMARLKWRAMLMVVVGSRRVFIASNDQPSLIVGSSSTGATCGTPRIIIDMLVVFNLCSSYR